MKNKSILNLKNSIDFKILLIKEKIDTFAFNNGIGILVFKKKNYRMIANIMSHAKTSGIDRVFLEDDIFKFLNKLDIKGRPDYFIWKDKEFYFTEYKSCFDIIRESQYRWYTKYHKLPLLLIQSSDKRKVTIK